MTETLTVTSERVDDLPLLLAQLEHMGVHALLDEHFPTHLPAAGRRQLAGTEFGRGDDGLVDAYSFSGRSSLPAAGRG